MKDLAKMLKIPRTPEAKFAINQFDRAVRNAVSQSSFYEEVLMKGFEEEIEAKIKDLDISRDKAIMAYASFYVLQTMEALRDSVNDS